MADILIVVIDVNKYLNQINTGIDQFLKDHIKSILDNQLNKSKIELDELLKNKEIVITFNKKDLLNKAQLKNLEDLMNNCDKKIVVSRIECGENQNNISELLDKMKISLSKL